jgi:hypothetical protein
MTRSSSHNSNEGVEQPFKSRFGFLLNEADDEMAESLVDKLDSKVFSCFPRPEETIEQDDERALESKFLPSDLLDGEDEL